MNDVKTTEKLFVFPSFTKAADYQPVQLHEYRKKHPNATSKMGYKGPGMYTVSYFL